MRTSSAKAKGRRLAMEVKEALLKYHPDLQAGDILVTSSGVTGEDLVLSPAARLFYPFTIECKNQEAISIWEALKQAESHNKDGHAIPLLVFRRNRTEPHVALKLEDFLKLVT